MLATVFAACDNKPKFLIEGQITDAADSVLYLEANTLDGVKLVDSVRLKADGDFRFRQAVLTESPEFYMLRIGTDRISFSVDSTENITIRAALPGMSQNYTVEGNESSVKIQEICRMQQRVQQRIVLLEQNTEMYPGDIADSIEHIVKTYKEQMKRDYIFPDPPLPYSYSWPWN